MSLDRVSNPGPLGLESDALPTALCGPALKVAVGGLKVGSCPDDDNSVQILFCPFLCSI